MPTSIMVYEMYWEFWGKY